MNRLRDTGLLLVVFLLFGCSETVDETRVIEYHENGIAKIVHDYYNKADSTFNEFWFYNTGKKMLAIEYNYGQRDGLLLRYYQSGRREILTQYQSGRLNGDFTAWFEDGSIKSKRHFKNDTLTQLANFYPNGQLIGDVKLEGGRVTEGTYYHVNGTLRSKGKFSAGRKVGVWAQYDSLGTLLENKDWGDGLRPVN